MRWALVLALLAGGCDASEPTLYVPTYDPLSTDAVAQTEFCALLARNTCAVLRPCCSALPFSFDEAKCQRASRAQCEARRQKSLEIGLVYDDMQAGRCVRGTAILLPECRSPRVDDDVAADVAEACRMVFHGGAHLGESCRTENPVACAPPALGVRVRCSGHCEVREILGPGDECSLASPARCGSGLICEGQPSRCGSRFLPLGAECTPSSPDSDRCDITRDRFCNAGGYPPVCEAMPTLGDNCTAVPGCARPYRCDTDRDGQQRCTEAKQIGQACADNGECATKLCAGQIVKVCVPSGIGPPIVPAGGADPAEYVARIAAACSGIIPDGAGGLAPFELPADPAK